MEEVEVSSKFFLTTRNRKVALDTAAAKTVGGLGKIGENKLKLVS
jgi:hypothetical protein